VNYIGIKQGSRLQTFLTLAKLGAIALIILLGFSLGVRLPEHFATGGSVSQFTIRDILLALVAGLFAFGGWHMVTYSSEETIDPRRTIPRSLVLGTLIVTASYLALNAAYMFVLPLKAAASSTRIAADAADAVVGSGGGGFMSAIVVLSTLGGLSGVVLCGPRVYYSMARDGLLFRWFGGIHPRYRTPHRAVVLQAIWSSVLVVTGTYRTLFTRVVYTEWIFFGLLAIGLIVLRRRPGVTRGYSIWGYPLVPILFIVSSFAIVLNQVISSPSESIFGLSLVLLGLPVYYLWANKPQEEPS
jgi:APA family basic amino acid/polyamine antiporter